MINTYRNKQRGFSTLMLTLVVLVSVTILAFISAGTVLTHQKVVLDERQMNQSFNAAQAGLDYGIKYVDDNYSTIIDGQTITGTLTGGASYSVVLDFQGGKNNIEIESTGQSVDGQVQSTVVQIVKYQSGLSASPPPQPLTVRGSVDLQGNTKIMNNEGYTNIVAGGTIELQDTAATFLSGFPSSTAFFLSTDVSQGDADISSMTDSELVSTFLGQSISSVQSAATSTFTEGADHNYVSELNGMQGNTIAINQLGGTARILGNATIGSEANPVNLVVDGDLTVLSGLGENIKIHGNVIVTGNLKLLGNVEVDGLVLVMGDEGIRMEGNAKVVGGVVSGGDALASKLVLIGNANITYSTPILSDTLSNLPGIGGAYGRVSGSWKDFNNS